MSLADEIRQRLGDAISNAESWTEIQTRLTASVPEGSEEEYRAFVWAFAYDLVMRTDIDRREREGSPFGAAWEFDGRRMPPRLADVPDEVVAQWRDAAAAVDDPRAVSRLGDLLWERRSQPRPDLQARAACEALVALLDVSGWSDWERVEGLVRALELARAVGDPELQSRAVARMMDALDDELESGNDERPGVTFTYLRSLVDLPDGDRPRELESLLSRAAALYGADPFQAETAADLQALLAPAEELPKLRRAQAERWRAAAAEAKGILRLDHLQRALEVARKHGLSDLAEELRVEIGGISEEELDLKTVSSGVQLPTDQVEGYLDSFVRDETWQQALMRFGAQGPPGGEPERVEAQVDALMQQHPIQYLVTKAVLDPDTGAAIFHAVDEASHRTAARAEHRTMSARLWSVFALEILKRVRSRYGQPEHDEFVDFFTSPVIDAPTADRFARGLELLWAEQPDESAHVLAPRIESVLRELARRLGIPVIQEPIGAKPGGVRRLGTLIHAMKGRLPTPGWHAYIEHLLSDPLGLNLRNVIGHGLRARIDAADAALLIHTACFLRLIEVQPANPGGDGS